FDTAVNTALEAIDRIRDTAASHERLFLVEVMGRTCGEIALGVGVAGGAEDVLIPEQPTDLDTLGAELKRSWERGKRSSIIVVAESGKEGHVFTVADRVRALTGLEPRVCVFGHIQRGGTPTAETVILACAGERVVAALALGRGAPEVARLSVVIDPEYRGRRLGTWLVLDAVHLAAALGVERLEATLHPEDTAYLAALERL